MKKTNKRNILVLIFLIILIIILLRAFSNSRASKVIEITANIEDNSSLLVDEKITLEAINEGESGFSITLPNVINTKKVTKYIVTQKELIENTEKNTKSNLLNTTNEPANGKASNSKSSEETNTINVQQVNTITEDIEKTSKVEKLPGEKIYLTQEERKNSSITLTVEYDKKEIQGEIFYNKELIFEEIENNENNEENQNTINKENTVNNKEYENKGILSVSGYMPYDTELETTEVEIDKFKTEILEKYPNYRITENFDIQLMSQGKEYLAKKYEQPLTIKMAMPNQDKTYTILEIQEDKTQEEKIQENT